MKGVITMFKNFFVLLVSALLLVSFSFAQQGTTTKKEMKSSSDTTHHMKMSSKGAGMTQMKDSFAMKAASGGMMEVELGKYASTNASSQEVKDFGSMMVTDHSKANDELMGIIKNSKMTAPDSMMREQKNIYKKLTKLTGSKFDKEYMKTMVQDHKKDIREFEKASKNEKNNDLKNWASNTLPTLKKHLQSAQDINKKLK